MVHVKKFMLILQTEAAPDTLISTTMGLLDDILDIGKEFKSLRDEVVGGVTDVVSSVAQPIDDVRDSIKESTKELKDSVDIDNASK